MRRASLLVFFISCLPTFAPAAPSLADIAELERTSALDACATDTDPFGRFGQDGPLSDGCVTFAGGLAVADPESEDARACVRALQSCLVVAGRDTGAFVNLGRSRVDGVIGPDTRASLASVCGAVASSTSRRNDVLAAVAEDCRSRASCAGLPEPLCRFYRLESAAALRVALAGTATGGAPEEGVQEEGGPTGENASADDGSTVGEQTPEKERPAAPGAADPSSSSAESEPDPCGPEPLEGVVYPSRPLLANALSAVLRRKPEDDRGPPPACLVDETAVAESPGTIDAITRSSEVTLGRDHSLPGFEAADCDCNREHAGGRTTWAMFPFWEVLPEVDEGEAVPALTIDFSTLSRIGYAGRYVTPQGGIDRAPWMASGEGGHEQTFIDLAHRYDSRVDLVIVVDEVALARRANGVVLPAQEWIRSVGKEVFAELGLAPRGVLRRIRDVVSTFLTGRDPSRAAGDGVTLWIPGPVSAESKGVLKQLIRHLREEIAAHAADEGEVRELGLLLTPRNATAASGAPARVDFGFQRELYVALNCPSGGPTNALQCGAQEQDGVPPFQLMTFLPESTSKEKKDLRGKIEDGFQGSNRRVVLRSVTPVLPAGGGLLDWAPGAQEQASTPLGCAPLEAVLDGAPDELRARERRLQQFDDDLVYLEDNFAGAGFWGLPAVSGGAGPAPEVLGDVLVERIRCVFESPQTFYSDWDHRHLSTWVCPHRQVWVLAWLLFFVLAVVLTRLRGNCRTRSWLEQSETRRIGALALLWGTGLAALSCAVLLWAFQPQLGWAGTAPLILTLLWPVWKLTRFLILRPPALP